MKTSNTRDEDQQATKAGPKTAVTPENLFRMVLLHVRRTIATHQSKSPHTA